MADELLISANEDAIYAAQIDAGELISLTVHPAAEQQQIGNIYLGCVQRVMPKLNAAFVDIGEARDGFLGAREARCLVPHATNQTIIQDCVHEGDIILVQAQNVPRDGKGMALTADVSLAGHAIVLTPCRLGISISRAITDDSERGRLIALVESTLAAHSELACDGMDGPAGWLIRTAAQGLDGDALLNDMRQLVETWISLSDETDNIRAPHLLYEDLDVVARILRDQFQSSHRAIVIEGEAALKAARDYCARIMPQASALISASAADEHLFDRYDIEGEIARARARRVDLHGGGNLVFETTSAMVTVDVNSGSARDNTYAVNIEAAGEIARQIILRGLGGLIAIDFIDMTDIAAREQIISALEAGFAHDKMPVRIGPMSEFGVVELTRRRSGYTLDQAMRGGFNI